jgi:hypothetical protein
LAQAEALWESKSQIAGLACQDTRYKGPVYQTARQDNNNNQSADLGPVLIHKQIALLDMVSNTVPAIVRLARKDCSLGKAWRRELQCLQDRSNVQVQLEL